jgi:hypothetical protein
MGSKPLITVLMFATMLYSGSSQLAHADPTCGPKELVRVGNKFCNKFKPSFKDILLSVVVPAYGISKASLYSLCKSAINGGFLIDALVVDCCTAHDACYSRGGTLSCKNTCDAVMLACTTTHVRPYVFGPQLAPLITAAATAGGLATFNFTDDPRCGGPAPPPDDGDTGDDGLISLRNWFWAL